MILTWGTETWVPTEPEPRHTWHTHLSFARSEVGYRFMVRWYRSEAEWWKGDHGMVKANRDAMRHFAKLEARQL